MRGLVLDPLEVRHGDAARVAQDGGLLDFHSGEVRASEQIRQNAQTSILVLDRTKFGRMAPALGVNIAEIDQVICDRSPDPDFSPIIERLGDRIAFSEDAE